MSDETRSNEDEEEKEGLAAIAAIEARIEMIVTILIQARTSITELRTFLADCGYGFSQNELSGMEIRVREIATALLSMGEVF